MKCFYNKFRYYIKQLLGEAVLIRKIESSKIILRSFCTADELERAVLFQKNLCTAELAVVIVAHRETVCACIVDIDYIANINLRKHTVNCELVAVLAKTACYIVLVVAGLIFLAITVI